MDIIFSAFDDLTSAQIEDVLALRQQVFIIEQQCFYEDIDREDHKARHLLYYDDMDLAAYLRIFDAGVKYAGEASIGRIVVAPKYRRTGLGPKLIRKGIELCEGTPVRIEAQSALTSYYNQLGFKEEGNIYLVDGINHIQMIYSG